MRHAWLALAALGMRASLAADEPVITVDGLLALPPVLSPGELIEAAVRDPVRTPPGGQWTVAGAEAHERDGRVSVRLPETLVPGQPIQVRYRDPAGAVTVDAQAAWDVRPPSAAWARPSLTSASAHAVAGGEACVCGRLPPGSWDALRLAGQPLPRISASSRAVRFRVPPGLAPGAHLLGGETSAGFRPGDRLVVRLVGVSGRAERAELRRGQRTRVEVRVDGTEQPLAVRLDNATPGVASLDGSIEPASPTSGGTENRLIRGLRGERRGAFLLHYRIELPSACACADDGDASGGEPPPGFVPGRVLALVRPAGGERAPAQAIAAAHGLVVEAVHDLPLTGEALVALAGAADVGVTVAALQRDPRVRIAQPDHVHEVAAAAGSGAALAYGPRLIGVDRLPAGADGRGVTVGLIDTGVDTEHRLLAGKIAGQEDLTGYGLGPDVHGTMMAGAIVAGAGRNGLRGVAPGARLLVFKACQPASPQNALAHCRSSALIPAVDRAAVRGAQVLNLSVAGSADEGLADRVRHAESRGHIVVAAVGQQPDGVVPYPASLEEALAVTAVDAAAAAYPLATQGTFVDLAAPGVEVLTTVPDNGQAVCDGTSAATAFVSGAMAVLRQQVPGLSPAAARRLVQRTARDLGPAGKDPQFGSGLLDLCAALAEASGGEARCR